MTEELQPDETALGWLEKALDDATEVQLTSQGLADATVRDELRADVRVLGLWGSLAALAEPAEADAEVAAEAPAAYAKELSEVVGPGAPTDLAALVEAYKAKKGAAGADLARKVLGRSIHALYELEAHGLTADDALRALSLVPRGRAESNARDLCRAIAQLSKVTARTVLGHLEAQIELVHRLATEELMPSEIDRPLTEFAPRVFARRVPSIVKLLLPKEARLRLAVVLWGRLRGVAIGRDALLRSLDKVLPERPITLASALARPEVRERRRALVAADRAAPLARVLEDVALDPDAFPRKA